MRYVLPLAVVVLAHAGVVSIPHAETIHGHVWINDYYGSVTQGWHRSAVDFDTQQVKFVSFAEQANADLGVLGNVGPGACDAIDLWPLSGASGAAVPGVAFESLSEAPEPPYCCLNVVPEINRTYVLLTADGHFVKFTPRSRVMVCDQEVAVYVEYVVQTDGTREFGPLLAVESTTWGRVKALYR